MSDPFELPPGAAAPRGPVAVAGGLSPQAWDDLFPGAKEKREEQQEKGWAFAQRYLVFQGATADPRARDLLEHWTQMVRRKVVPPNASLGELAATNAVREFVEAIHAQIELALNGPQQPPPRTKP